MTKKIIVETKYIDKEHFDTRVRLAVGMAGEEELTKDFKDGVLTVLDYFLKTEENADVIERKEIELLKRQLANAWNRIDELDKLNGHMREKINKAIEEIEEFKEELFNMPNTNYEGYASVKHCLEILHRHLEGVNENV